MSRNLSSCMRCLVCLAVFNMTLGELCAQIVPAAPAGPPEPQGLNGSLDLPLLKAHLAEKLDAGNKPTDPTASFPATAAWVHLMVQIKQDSPDGMVMITMYQAGRVEDKRIVEAKAGTRFVVSFYPLRADTFPVGHWWVTFKVGGQVLASIPFTVGDATPSTPTAPTTAPGAPTAPNDQPPAPGPPPTGLEPMPPLEPRPPTAALPQSPLPPVPAGQKLAEATIGPMGGTVEAPGKLTLTFPAGALAEDEQITITTGPALLNGRLYDVSRTGKGEMAKSVQVTFPVPEGVDATKVVPLQEVAEDLCQVPFYRCNQAAREVTASVSHFSFTGWMRNIFVDPFRSGDRTGTAVAGSAFGAFVGCCVFLYKVGLVSALLDDMAVIAAAATPGMIGIVLLAVVVGFFIANPAWSAVGRARLSGPLPAGRFRIYWSQADLAACPTIWLALERNTRRLLGPHNPEAYTPTERAQGRSAEGKGPITFPGVEATFCYGDLEFIAVPRPLFGVAAELQYADTWYAANNMAPPPGNIDVRVESDDNPGGFYLSSLRLDAKLLVPVPGNPALTAQNRNLVAGTIAHEFFHYICDQNGWTEGKFVGREDSLCVAMESMVFPYAGEFQEFGWIDVFVHLRNGLLNRGPGEANNRAERRGYYLWPWTHYLGRRYGPMSLHTYAEGAMSDQVVASFFRHFCYGLIAEDYALRDPMAVNTLDGQLYATRTGWRDPGGRDNDNANQATLGNKTARIPLGEYDLAPSRPLSFRVAAVEVPRPPKGVLVVRRERPEPTEEFIALKPVLSTAGGVTLSSGHTTQDMVAMTGGVAVRGIWVDGLEFKSALPVAVICTATTPQSAPQAGNRLLSYRLNPPSDIVVQKEPDKPTRLSWKLPDLGCNLNLTDCVGSYRVFGKSKGNRVDLIAELILSDSAASLPQVPGRVSLRVTPSQTAVELPAALTEQYVALGMQSMDGALTYAGGKQVMSDVSWSPLVCTIALTPNPFEVTVGHQMVFDAKADYPPPNAHYRWVSTGRVLKSDVESAPVQFDTEGPASVTVSLWSEEGRKLCSATANGTVKKKEAPPEQPTVAEKPADEPAQPRPGEGVWRLKSKWLDAGHSGNCREEITATSIDLTAMDPEGKLQQHSRFTWSPLPETLLPGQDLVVTLTARVVEWAGKEQPWMVATTFIYSDKALNQSNRFDRVDSGMDNRPVSREFRVRIPEGRLNLRTYEVELRGFAGVSASHCFLWEWVPAKP